MNTASLVRSRLESNEPQDTILEVLRKYDGKRLTTRHAEKINQAIPALDCRISKRYGMTAIEWGNYWSSGGTTGGSLHMAHCDINVVIDVAFILEKNKAYFSAKDTRNETRQKALADPVTCAAVDAAIQRYQEAKGVMETLLLNPAFDADRSFIEKEIESENEY